jgi:GT2 family glycosyltransferase
MKAGSKQRRMTFDVIVPTLNAPTIDKTLFSLIRQHCPEIEYHIIVVGQDRDKRIPSHDKVHFIETEQPSSPAEARNRGVMESSSRHLAFIDADCIAREDWLQTMADSLAGRKELVIGGGVAFDRKNYLTFIDNLATFHDSLALLPSERRDQLPSLNLAMHRKAFEQVGGFDERFPHAAGEDSDLTYRLKQAGYSLIFTPEAVVQHEPARNSFRQLIRHAYTRGYFSLLVDPRYEGEIGLPRPLRIPFVLILASPLIALFATLRAYSRPKMVRYLIHLPVIYLTKLAWCFGAFQRSRGPDPILDGQEHENSLTRRARQKDVP